MVNRDKISRISEGTMRNGLRAGTVGAVVTFMMLVSSPAFAYYREDGSDPGPGLSVAQTIGIFVCIPIAAFSLITFLVCLPSIVKKGK